VNDRNLAIFMVALCVAYLWGTTKVPVLEIGDPLGPRAFPYLVGVLGLITAVWLFVEIAARRRSASKAAAGETRHRPWAVFLTLAWMAAFYTVLEPFGFVLSTFLFLLGLTCFFNRNRWVTNILVSAGFPLGVYFAFTKLLSISLPAGVLPI